MLALCPDVTYFFVLTLYPNVTVLLIDNLVCCSTILIGLVVYVCFVHMLALLLKSLSHVTNSCCSVVHTHVYYTFICCSVVSAVLTCTLICCSVVSAVLICTFICCSIVSAMLTHIHLLLCCECRAVPLILWTIIYY